MMAILDGIKSRTLITQLFFSFVLTLATNVAFSETQQRIDYHVNYSSFDPAVGQYEIFAELFTTKTDDTVDPISPIFWVKVSENRRSAANGNVSEVISIREFPTTEYRRVLNQLKSVPNISEPRVYRRLFLADGGGYTVRFDKNTQLILDLGGPAPDNIEKVDSRMLTASRMLRVLIRKTIRNPDTSYRRR